MLIQNGFVIYMQSILINRHAVLTIVKQEIRMASKPFDTMEMAFVYGVVTLALTTSDKLDSSENHFGRLERVATLLSQGGFDVVLVEGRKGGKPHEWLEVGHPGEVRNLVVDISTPDRPRDTVYLKKDRTSKAF